MEILIILALILLNGLFAMSEIALVSSKRATLLSEAKKGSSSAKIALELSEKPERFLSTVQIGITLIGILTGIYSGDVLSADLSELLKKLGVPYAYPIAQGMIVICVTYLTLIFGELVPKRLGLAFAERMAKLVGRPMRFLSIVAAPFVWILSKSTLLMVRLFGLKLKPAGVTEDEIRLMVREGTEGGEVQKMEQHIVERTFTLGDRDIESIMTHRSDVAWLSLNASADEVRACLSKSLHKVYPVGREGLDDIAGVVYLRDLLSALDGAHFSLEAILKPAEKFHADMKVYAAFEQMREKHLQYGFVYDEFGSMRGLVTLGDILRELVGYNPEQAREPEIVERKGGGWLVDGQCNFYDFLAYFSMSDLYAENEYNTLSGLALEILGHIPQAGECFEWKDFSFEIADMDGARIDKIIVSKIRPTSEAIGEKCAESKEESPEKP